MSINTQNKIEQNRPHNPDLKGIKTCPKKKARQIPFKKQKLDSATE